MKRQEETNDFHRSPVHAPYVHGRHASRMGGNMRHGAEFLARAPHPPDGSRPRGRCLGHDRAYHRGEPAAGSQAGRHRREQARRRRHHRRGGHAGRTRRLYLRALAQFAGDGRSLQLQVPLRPVQGSRTHRGSGERAPGTGHRSPAAREERCGHGRLCKGASRQDLICLLQPRHALAHQGHAIQQGCGPRHGACRLQGVAPP